MKILIAFCAGFVVAALAISALEDDDQGAAAVLELTADAEKPGKITGVYLDGSKTYSGKEVYEVIGLMVYQRYRVAESDSISNGRLIRRLQFDFTPKGGGM